MAVLASEIERVWQYIKYRWRSLGSIDLDDVKEKLEVVSKLEISRILKHLLGLSQ